jgi:hypothetical protein
MTAKQDRIIAKLEKQLNGLMAKSQTTATTIEKDEAGNYVNLVIVPAGDGNWRESSLAMGVSKLGKIRLHTNKCKGGACVVAENVAELETIFKEAIIQAKKLTETFVPIPKK